MSSESSIQLPNDSMLRASLRSIALIAGSSFLFIGTLAAVLAAVNVTSAPAARDNVTSGAVDSPDKAKGPSRPATEAKQKS